MTRIRTVHIPPTLVRGRVRRLVETRQGIVLVEAWSANGWQAEPSDLISPSELNTGVDAPTAILRALGVPESDWPVSPASLDRVARALSIWSLLEWGFSPLPLQLLLAA